jgi:hypothetical protein
MLEDMIHDSDLDVIVLVLWRAPPDTGFETILSEHGNTKNVCLNIFEEAHVIFACSDFELLADVFEEMDMADLDNDIGEDILCSLLDSWIVITGNRDEWIVHVLQLRKELHPCFEALRAREDATREIVRCVIHAIEEGNLLLVALHLHIFSINNQGTTEAFAVAIVMRDLVVVGKVLQLFYDPCIRSIESSTDTVCKCANTQSFEMKTEK